METLLSQWTPRRPSPALRRRTFAPAAADAPPAWSQFAPPALAAAALALAFILHPVRLESAVGAAGRWTNAAALTYRHSARQCANNALPVAGFAWTNTSPAPSTNVSVGGL